MIVVALWVVANACHDPVSSQRAILTGSGSASTETFTQSSGSNTQPTGSDAARFDKIHTIQGTAETPRLGHARVQAVVTASFQGKDKLRGFFLQEEDKDADNNPKTSEGLFVYCGECKQKVSPGDLVEVHGPVMDYYGMTQINISKGGTLTIAGHGYPLPSPAILRFPLPLTNNSKQKARAQRNALLESKEGMRVQIPQVMTLANIYHLPRYGEITLSSQSAPRQYGDIEHPTKAGFLRHQIQRLATQIRWDDDNNRQNASTPTRAKNKDRAIRHPFSEGLSIRKWLRAGDRASGIRGILHWSYAGQKGTDAWRIRSGAEPVPAILPTNPRPTPPKTPGRLKVASFNVLNFFSSLNKPGQKCGPQQTVTCRGANSLSERNRQAQKLVAAICALDADIVGMIEIENDSTQSIELLVAQLNRHCPTYKAVVSGTLGQDAIKVGMIYRPGKVKLQGKSHAVTEHAFTAPAAHNKPKNRPALYQAFVERSSKQGLGIVVNHFKSKGSSCGAGDDDPVRGQGNCNRTRTLAAKYLATWLEKNAAQEKLLILGDLNAYRYEDPLRALKNQGYLDLVARDQPDAYTYRFEGEVGNLDYALANPALAKQVQSAQVWHINTDESALFDYNDSIKDPGEKHYERKSSAVPLFKPDAFRASDHDPIVVGISLEMRE